MATTILILAHPEDVHAYAVAEALRRKGTKATIWNMSNFPMKAGETLHIANDRSGLTFSGPESDLSLENVAVVWNRRPSYSLDPSKLHPADREYAELCCRQFRTTLIGAIAPEAFWINPPNSEQRCSKMRQQLIATHVGLKTPDTIYSNDPREIRLFIREQGGQVAYKSMVTPLPWQDEEKSWQLFTSLVTEGKLVDDTILRLTPAIYQAIIPKAFELRVTFIGDAYFAAKLDSQSTETGRLDWRRSYHELSIEEYTLPETVENRCLAVLANLNLVFGTFDIIVTPNNDFVFLEVNQMGQFLFIERYTQQPLLNALCEMLIQRTTSYNTKSSPIVPYHDVMAATEAATKEAAAAHVVPTSRVWDERANAQTS